MIIAMAYPVTMLNAEAIEATEAMFAVCERVVKWGAIPLFVVSNFIAFVKR